MTERTTDLMKLRLGDKFTWGYVLKWHEVGEYVIIEYHPWKVKGTTVLTGDMDESKKEFSCYINGKSINESTDNLDTALALCIAHKHEGPNQQASYYFMKMIKKGE